MSPSLLFWTGIGWLLASTPLLIISLRRRRWFLSVFLIILAMFVISGVKMWYPVAYGECANVPKVVPYREGMTLCPGQSTVIIIPFNRKVP